MGDPCEKRGDRFYLSGPKFDVEVLPDLVPLLRPIGELKTDPANPRKTILLDDLVAGIKRFGVRWPILVNKRTSIIEAGHQRLFACQDLGLSHIPVIWADDDNLTATGFNISDNRLGEIVSEWDDEALARQLKAMVEESEEAIEGIGFEREEIDWMISEYLDSQGEGGEPPEPPDMDSVAAITERGDIWKLGPHRLICGDSTDPAVIGKLMQRKTARMIFTDPPYNVDYSEDRKIENDALGEEFFPFLLKAFQAMLPVCDGAVYVCMSSSELDTLQKAFRDAGGHWSTFIIWAKNTFTIGRSDYQRQYEPILYGWREGAKDRHWCGDRDQGDVWHYDKPKVSKLHPTMKPIELVERAIKNSSIRNDLILDCFLGSGTTLIAAEMNGRVCNGCELDPRYADVICQRFYDMTSVSPIRDKDGAEWVDLAFEQDKETGKPKKREPKKG